MNGTIIEEIAGAAPMILLNGQPSDPLGFILPADNYNTVLSNSVTPVYLTVMRDGSLYSYERLNADSLLEDKISFGSHVSVSSSDTTAKNITLHVATQLDSSERIFFVRNTQLRQNDSLFTREVSQSNLVLKNYGTAKTYHLEINERSAQEQEIFVHRSLTLQANSTHTIVPNWVDLDRSPIQIWVDLGNNGTIDDTLIVNNTVDVDDRGDLGVPREYHLAQNYPNPFNPTTRIEYALPHASHVKLTVHNILGQLVATLVDEIQQPGLKSVQWDATSMASGVYFYRMQSGPFSATRKLLLVR